MISGLEIIWIMGGCVMIYFLFELIKQLFASQENNEGATK